MDKALWIMAACTWLAGGGLSLAIGYSLTGSLYLVVGAVCAIIGVIR